ncbi:MAG: hypothetical protein QF817_01235 [Candidatus Poseidoniaceae archaeon]|jgi:hypothetical protein|nr:hypothetical protein [Candidatus Poseidoniaceae archaeon]
MRRICIIIIAILLLSVFTTDPKLLQLENPRDFALPGCPEEPAAVSIEITHSGSGSVPADQHLQLTAIVKDSSSQTLGVFPTWGVSNGSITSDGLFTPLATGEVEVWACIGEVNQSKTLTVLQGETVSAELQLSDYQITSDEVVQLLPKKIDSKGNRADTFVPTENFSLPVGSNISGGQILNWFPGPVGNHTISANVLGYSVSVQVNVSFGQAVGIGIESSSNEITSDQSLELALSILDGKGNTQPIIGEWYSRNNTELPLSITNTSALVEGNVAGIWRVIANYSGAETNGSTWTTYRDITVIHGALTATRIDGFIISRSGQGNDLGQLSGTLQMNSDDQLVLSPRLEDADGNILPTTGLTWKLESDNIAFPETSSNNSFTFSPVQTGNYIVTLTPAEGIPERLTIEVRHGEAEAIEVYSGASENLVVSVGQNLSFEVFGVDRDGNNFPLDVEWFIPEHTGNISNGSLGVGNYVFTSSRDTPIRIHTLKAITALGKHDVLVDVRIGILHHLQIDYSPLEGVQGEELQITITGRDLNDNQIPIALDDVILTSSAGTAEYRNGKHYLYLEESGVQHQITAEYEELPPAMVFIDIQATIFGGVLGSSETVIIGGIAILSVILLALAVMIYKISGRRKKSDDELIEEMVQTNETSQSPELSSPESIGDSSGLRPETEISLPVIMPLNLVPPPPLANMPAIASVPQSAMVPPVAQPSQQISHGGLPPPLPAPMLAHPPAPQSATSLLPPVVPTSMPAGNMFQPHPQESPQEVMVTQPQAEVDPNSHTPELQVPTQSLLPTSQESDLGQATIDLSDSLSALGPIGMVEVLDEPITEAELPIETEQQAQEQSALENESEPETEPESPAVADIEDPFPAPLLETDGGWGDDDPFGDWGSGVANSRALGLIDTFNGPMSNDGVLLEPEQGTIRGQSGWYRMTDGTRVEWKYPTQ